jgi:hypothetical protein
MKNKEHKSMANNYSGKNGKHEMQFPIKSVLYLKPLIDFWRNNILSDEVLGKLYAASFEEQLKNAPELLQPNPNPVHLQKHSQLIELLMTAIFPPAQTQNEIAAAYVPFTSHTIFATSEYRRLFDYIQKCNKEKEEQNKSDKYLVVMLHAYRKILQHFYGIELNFEFPWVFDYKDQESGLDRYFKMEVDPQFVEIKNLKEVKPLSDEEKVRLHDNLTDLDIWQEIIPMNNFEFRGVALYKATDVTDSEILSHLKYEMSKTDVLKSTQVYDNLQHKLRSLFRLPELQIGFSGIRGEKQLLHDCGHDVGRSLFLNLAKEYCPVDFQKSIYGQMIKNRQPVIILDLTKYQNRTSIENKLIEHGLINIALLPLIYDDQLLGLVELAAPTPSVINAVNILKLDSLIPIFVMAIRRHMEALFNRVQNIIREEATAIHPSVEWRFRNAALNKIQEETREGFAEMEPIIFDDVHSLYGLSDIRGSSTKRNHVIQEDLIDHLHLAKNVLQQANRTKPMPIFEELIFRTENYIVSIAKTLNSEEESRVLEFLHSEVEEIFDHLEDYDVKVKNKIKKYRQALDAELGFVYNKRKDFEDSVAQVNDVISAYIDKEEEKAQAIFPHYFEKYKTDGVDYNMYVGASLVENRPFNPIYLKNFRLWQLILMCGIAEKSNALKSQLKMPLDTAHLILVQSMPISIQFRFDEKRFDVNGAYNVKYEIVKKRIDKAVIKSNGERLTQPGKIAIVYSNYKDAAEYREYIDYLQSRGYIEDEVNDVELKDMQGVQGLRALRVTVNMNKNKKQEERVPESVEQAIREMSQNALE